MARGSETECQTGIEQFLRDGGAFLELSADGGVDALPQARRREENGGPHGFDLLRQFHEAFGESDGHAAADGQQFDYDALRDVRRGQECHGAVVGSCGQHVWSHVDVGDQCAMADHHHFGLAGGAGGQVENGVVGWLHFRAESIEQAGIARDSLASALAQLIERDGAGRFAGEQNPLGHWRFFETFEGLGIFSEDGFRIASLNGTDKFLRRISGIKRRRRRWP